MELFEAVYGRRSTRSFSEVLVEREQILALLRAAVQAPSALNRQPWLFTIVQDRERLRRWSDQAKALYVAHADHDATRKGFAALLRNASYDVFHRARTLIVISCAVDDYASADGWLAAGTMMLAAQGLGLASCCIGLVLPVLAQPEVRAELQLPDKANAIAALVVGHAREQPAPVPRAEPRITAWLGEAAPSSPSGS